MKTLKQVTIVPKFVEYIPEKLEQDLIYISRKFNTSVHLCLCGCGNESVAPFEGQHAWNLSENDGKVSFTPSIQNKNCPNQYHYIITKNVANVC
jgi:hypothetical protein